MSLPPNYETARQLLHEHGPLTVPELATRLRDTGRFIDEDRLLQLPELHPEDFTSLPDGRLTLPDLGVVDPEDDSTEDPPTGWWHTQLAPDPWPREGVLVIDIETTGLSLERDQLTRSVGSTSATENRNASLSATVKSRPSPLWNALLMRLGLRSRWPATTSAISTSRSWRRRPDS